jgi:hypothetical protein
LVLLLFKNVSPRPSLATSDLFHVPVFSRMYPVTRHNLLGNHVSAARLAAFPGTTPACRFRPAPRHIKKIPDTKTI